MAEQAWRPRPCGYAHRRSGSPWVPVRPYHEGLPSQEGQYGSDEGRRKPPGSRGVKVPRFGPDEHGPGVEDATSGAPGGCVPARHAGAFTEVPDYEVAPIGAPLPHVGEGKENEGAPRADQTAGAMTHAFLFHVNGADAKTESENEGTHEQRVSLLLVRAGEPKGR